MDQLLVVQPIQPQRPRIAVDEQQFPRTDLAVKLQLVAGAVVRTDDFDGKIRPTVPMGITVFGWRVVQEHHNVWATVVLLSIVVTIGDVGSGQNLSETSPTDSDL